MKRIIFIVSIIFFINFCYAGFFDKIKVVSEDEFNQLKKENKELKEEIARLKQENEKLKKSGVDDYFQYKNLIKKNSTEFFIGIDIKEDTSDSILTEKRGSINYLFDFKYSHLIDKIKINLKEIDIPVQITVEYYDSKNEKWSIYDSYNIDKKINEIKFRNFLNTDKIKLIPSKNIKRVSDLKIISFEIYGY